MIFIASFSLSFITINPIDDYTDILIKEIIVSEIGNGTINKIASYMYTSLYPLLRFSLKHIKTTIEQANVRVPRCYQHLSPKWGSTFHSLISSKSVVWQREAGAGGHSCGKLL